MPDTSHRPVSIVIPAYNPQERIFARALTAVSDMLSKARGDIECVIVDNRSNPAVGEMSCVRSFLSTNSCARVIEEHKQGLTYARLAGIRATSGDVVVVFDDDNVPGARYIDVVRSCMEKYPWVGVWGPGVIDVDLLDPVPPSIQSGVRQLHNQRRFQSVQYGCVPASYQQFYPIGMGQVIRRDVAQNYKAAVERGTLSATDRAGGSLASGGDIQIVWQAVNAGIAVGVHPELNVTHLIPGSRTTLRYMKRLAFGCGLAYQPAFVESFPEEYDRIRTVVPTTRQIASQLVRLVARHCVGGRSRLRFLPVEFAASLGLICGHLRVGGYGPEHWAFRFANRLGLT
jgi:Glycosyl transferase family 2